MSKPVTAADRLKRDGYLPINVLLITGWMIAVTVWAWPATGTDPETGWNRHPGFFSYAWGVLVGLLCLGIVGGALQLVWQRYGPGGGHHSDRWQAGCGELIDKALSGVTFRAIGSGDHRSTRLLADSGWQAIGTSQSLTGIPGGVGSPIAGPFAAVGLAAFGLAAVVGTGKAVAQHRRDQETTRRARGLAHTRLTKRREAVEAGVSAARSNRARHRALTELGNIDDALARLDRLGYTSDPD